MEVALQQPAKSRCRHCQRETESSLEFCCPGCQAAFFFITAMGMNEYYEKLNTQRLNTPVQEPSRWNQVDLSSYVSVLSPDLSRIDLRLDGITCSACAWLVERIPLFKPEILRVRTDLGTSQTTVVFRSDCEAQDVLKVFNQLGFSVQPFEAADSELDVKIKREWLMRVGVAGACALATMHVSLSLYAGLLEGMNPYLVSHIGLFALILCLPAVFYAAAPFFKNALLSLRMRRLNMDVLVSFSIAAGFLVSAWNVFAARNEFYFDAVTMLISLLLIGRMMVFFSERRLLKQNYTAAWDPKNLHKNLKVGDVLTIPSGAPFPCDGTILYGSSEMNAAFLTGEEIPVPIKAGDKIFCGAVNSGDQVTVRAESCGDQTKAALLLKKLVSVRKSQLVVLSQRLETIVVTVLFVGVAGLIVWQVLTNGFVDWHTIVALLMVTCPCALGLAVPAVMTHALSQAIKKGILIKDAEVLERIGDIEEIVFDKTGTLTSQSPVVTSEVWNEQIQAESGISLAALRSLIAASSVRSIHPLLVGLKRHLDGQGVIPADSSTFTSAHEFVGQGLELRWSTHVLRIGSRIFACGKRDPWGKRDSGIYICLDGRLAGRYGLNAELRTEAASVMARLRKSFKVVLLSGDRRQSVEQAAQYFGIQEEDAHFEQTPEMKLKFLDDETKKKKVMMVGDGINDILAFKKSHVSVAISGGGASIAHSDVYLIVPRLQSVVDLFKASHRIKSAILTNFGWAFLYNFIGIYLISKGSIGPVVCAILMPLSSLTVLSLSSFKKYFRED